MTILFNLGHPEVFSKEISIPHLVDKHYIINFT